MANEQSSSQAEKHKEGEKKLHKSEQRLVERLQEAREAQENALKRLQRAEARLSKRTGRVERIEDQLLAVRQELEAFAPSPIDTPVSAQADDLREEEQSRELEREQIAEIDEEEDIIESVAAMLIADGAATVASQAEARAEESSVRTRAARETVQQKEAALAQVRAAIEQSTLVGDAADAALHDAEHEATQARTALAEAEAMEERLRDEAMNAGAEAEVAGGMAFSVENVNEQVDRIREENSASVEVQHDGTEVTRWQTEDTVQHPIIRPQETV